MFRYKIKLSSIILFFIIPLYLFSQSFSSEKIALGNFLKRMYNSNSFEGVKVLEDYERKYLISVISLVKEKYNSQSVMMRVAQTKAQFQVNRFFNGTQTSAEVIVRTTIKDSSDTTITKVETVESIKENSVGFVNDVELLTNFDNDGKAVFIYYKNINSFENKKSIQD